MQAAWQLLAHYAEALNSANTALLPALYTADGVFMPDGVAPCPPARCRAGELAFSLKRALTSATRWRP